MAETPVNGHNSIRTMKFELQTLNEYSDEAILAELRRVAESLNSQRLTIERFDSIARVHSSTVRHHFGSWAAALDKAGISETIAPRPKILSRERVIQVVHDFAAENPGMSIARDAVAARLGVDGSSLTRRFGNWTKLLADESLKATSPRYTDDECFENIFALWTHYGRQPHHAELKRLPSTVGPKAYLRWGSWRLALAAFVERVNRDTPLSDKPPSELRPPPRNPKEPKRTPRDIPLGLRYRVVIRDGCQCQLCGRRAPQVKIHVDHIKPWAFGGETVIENLRVLCSDCNLGKGAMIENM
jgi:hypothetical protein